MKARMFLCALAASMMLFTACDPTEEEHNDQPTLSNNMLIYDGVAYNGQGAVAFFETVLQYVFDGSNFGVMGNIESNAYNHTFDLSHHSEGHMYNMHVNVGDALNLVYINNPQELSCSLNGQDLGNSSCFSNGTATITVANDTLTMQVEGTLINGKELKFKFTAGVPHTPEATTNEIVIGNTHYPINPSLSISNEGVFLFGADSNDIHLIVDLPASMMGQTIPLHEMFGPKEYYFDFISPTLSFSQQMNEDNPFARLNDEDLTHPVFSDGTLRFFEENGVYTVSIHGTLWGQDMPSFSAQISVPKTDIQAMDNQIVVDGQVFEGNASGTHFTTGSYSGQYILRIQGYDRSSGVSQLATEMSFYFDSSLIGRTINLTSSSEMGSYSLNGAWYPEPAWSYSQWLNNGTFQSRYGTDEDPQNTSLFTTGTFSIDEDEWAISLTHIGILTNGHSVSTQIRLDKTEFYDPRKN